MAPVEIHHHFQEAENRTRITYLKRGSSKRLAFPSEEARIADVFVRCNYRDSEGIVTIVSESDQVSIRYFDGVTPDDEGVLLDTTHPIKFSGVEAIEIVKHGADPIKSEKKWRLSHFKFVEEPQGHATFNIEQIISLASKKLTHASSGHRPAPATVEPV